MNRHIIIGLLIFFHFNAFAKTPIDTSYYHRGEALYLILPSFQYSSQIGLNQILNQHGVPTLSRYYFMAGLGFEDRWKWLALGCDFVYGVQEHSSDKYLLSSPLFVSSIWTKYYLKRSKTIGGIYPFGGFTFINKSVFITDKSTNADINQLFTQSGSVNMHFTSVFAQFGFGADFIDFSKNEDVYLNMKMGYRINIASSVDNTWYVDEKSSINGSPTEQLNAFFIQVAIGYNLNRKSNKQLRTN